MTPIPNNRTVYRLAPARGDRWTLPSPLVGEVVDRASGLPPLVLFAGAHDRVECDPDAARWSATPREAAARFTASWVDVLTDLFGGQK